MLSEADRYVLAGRLANYLGDLDRSIEIFTEGLERFPEDARLWRHRGHRFITKRAPELAVRDLTRAADLIEGAQDEHEFFQPETQRDLIDLVLGRPVGPQRLPVNAETNATMAGRYKSTLHGSVFYHLAIGHYLMAGFEDALEAFERCAAVAIDDDMVVAAADWRFTCLRRLGRHEDALAIANAVDVDRVSVNPSEDYYLQRIRMYRGELEPEILLERHADQPLAIATQGYAVGVHYLAGGDTERAKATFQRVVAEGAEQAFGRIAAEADLARL